MFVATAWCLSRTFFFTSRDVGETHATAWTFMFSALVSVSWPETFLEGNCCVLYVPRQESISCSWFCVCCLREFLSCLVPLAWVLIPASGRPERLFCNICTQFLTSTELRLCDICRRWTNSNLCYLEALSTNAPSVNCKHERMCEVQTRPKWPLMCELETRLSGSCLCEVETRLELHRMRNWRAATSAVMLFQTMRHMEPCVPKCWRLKLVVSFCNDVFSCTDVPRKLRLLPGVIYSGRQTFNAFLSMCYRWFIVDVYLGLCIVELMRMTNVMLHI